VSRRLFPVALILGVLAAACSAPPKAILSFGSGKQFVPQVADFLDNTGVDPSVAVTSDGTPYVASFAFLEQLAEGQIAPTRPIGTPSLPSVGLVSLKDGIWTRGGIAMQANISNVNVPFTPSAEEDLKTMTAANVNGTAIVGDAQGHLHVAWAADTGIWYADNTSGSFTATEILKLKSPLTQAGPLGAPSVAVMPDGMAWVAYAATTATGVEVRAATNASGAWKTQTVATFALCQGCPQPSRTAVGVLGDGEPIVVYSSGAVVTAATLKGKRWSDSTVALGSGAGLSLAVDQNGDPHVALYSGPSVWVASRVGNGSWDMVKVADVGSGTNEAGLSTGLAVVDPSTIYVTWYDPGTDSVGLALGDGSYTAVPLSGTSGGDSPAVAATSDGATVYLAWYDEIDQNLNLGTYGDVTGLAIANPSPVPTGAPSVAPPPTQECTVVKNGEVTVVAQGIAFQTACLQVPAGTPFTIHFDNKDASTQHNIQIFPGTSASGSPLFSGDIITGPATADYKVQALDKGDYFFNCVIHVTMTGKIVVK
jgi:hypothetical protein